MLHLFNLFTPLKTSENKLRSKIQHALIINTSFYDFSWNNKYDVFKHIANYKDFHRIYNDIIYQYQMEIVDIFNGEKEGVNIGKLIDLNEINHESIEEIDQ